MNNNNTNPFCCSSSCSPELLNTTTNNTNNTMGTDLKDVILHVYLLTDVIPTPYIQQQQGQQQQGQQQQQSRGSWLTRTFLPAIGFGAFHTSIQVYGYRYTFTGNYGIVKCFSHIELTGLPPNAIYQQSIHLGRTNYERNQVNEIIDKFSNDYFKPSSYHLVHRNCNHFTETFATALILGDIGLAEPDVDKLHTYPSWVNRLANTGQCIISTKMDGNATTSSSNNHNQIRTCRPIEEARIIVGADKKVGWSFHTWKSEQALKSQELQKEATNAKKKELTEAQKAALAKIRK